MKNQTNQDLNQNTQPIKSHRVFNNWDVIAKGFYFAMPSMSLKNGQAKSLKICGQHLVFYRGDSGEVYAMDGFCPHMGVDLGIGKVQGEQIQCFFHHWKFSKEGKCVDIPCGEKAPANTQLQTYMVKEKYGCIFVYPESHTSEDLVGFDEIDSDQVVWKIGEQFPRKCHHHITMINGIDPQHLKTVHNIDIEMDLEMKQERKNHIEITLKGEMPNGNLKEKIGRFILGDNYSYSMRYGDGTIGALTMMKDVKLFNRFKVPPLHMIYAYRPVEHGSTEVLPIHINKKRKGFLGHLLSKFQLWLTKTFFYMLRGEDGEVYDNIRFKTESLLKIDLPVARYVGYINQLEPSIWSSGAKQEGDTP